MTLALLSTAQHVSDVLTSETCWAVDNKASVIKLVNLYSNNKVLLCLTDTSLYIYISEVSYNTAGVYK